MLDYVNTVNGRPSFTRDDLATPTDLSQWAAAAGAVHRAPLAIGEVTAAQHRAAVDLRERLYGVFGPIATGGQPGRDDLAWVIRRAAEGMRCAELVPGCDGWEAHWSGSATESLCDRLSDAAVTMLRSPAVHWVKGCDGCGWLFLDTSRAHARRWCSMNACGARHKMRRYHERRSGAGGR